MSGPVDLLPSDPERAAQLRDFGVSLEGWEALPRVTADGGVLVGNFERPACREDIAMLVFMAYQRGICFGKALGRAEAQATMRQALGLDAPEQPTAGPLQMAAAGEKGVTP